MEGLSERPWRSIAVILSAAAGCGAAIAILVISQTAAQQVSARFDARRATQVVLTVAQSHSGLAARPRGNPFPSDVGDRLGRIDGVEAAGVLLDIRKDLAVKSFADADSKRDRAVAQLFAADSSLEQAAGLSIDGRWISGVDASEGLRVVVIGSAVAHELGISVPTGTIVLDDIPFAVVGIARPSDTLPGLAQSVVVPVMPLTLELGFPSPESSILVRTSPGAAQVVAAQAAEQARPDAPDSLQVSAPPDPKTLRLGVAADVKDGVIGAAAFGMLLGAVITGVSTSNSVQRRRSIIGIQRSLGATSFHIARIVTTESFLLGMCGGVMGVGLGLLAAGVVCVANGWGVIVDPTVVLSLPLANAALGVAAGLAPALNAGRIEPVEVLRS